MLLKLSDQISECLGYAVASREQANAAADPSRKADFLNMERRWLRLVESYRFVEQAARFLEDSHLARMPSSEKLPQTGVLVVTCPTTGKDFSTGIMTDAASLTLTPKELIRSHCPHCDVEHAWWTKDAKLVAALPPSKWVENARAEVAKANFDQKVMLQAAVKNASLSDLLDVLVRAVIEERNGEARAAFYMAEEGKLHHVTGMPKAYAKCVDGFVISPELLACGLAASTGQAIITRDVIEEPLWQPWLWLAKRFDYRGCWSFPVKTSSGNIVGTFAMYFKEPREATDRDLDFAATIARTAAIAMSRPHAAA